MAQIRIDTGLFFLLPAILLLLPLSWSCAWLIAAILHELFHILAVYASGGKITSLHIGIRGAALRCTSTASTVKDLICCAAGPAGSFLLCFAAPMFPRLAVCGFLQGMCNLLPVAGLDGNNILIHLLSLLPLSNPQCTAERISRGFEIVVWISAVIFLPQFGFWTLAVPILLQLRTKKEKGLANTTLKG